MVRADLLLLAASPSLGQGTTSTKRFVYGNGSSWCTISVQSGKQNYCEFYGIRDLFIIEVVCIILGKAEKNKAQRRN